jgi:NarL family two-component system response regulator LiaR
VITIITGQFEDLVSHGLRAILNEDDLVDLITTDVPMNALESAISEFEPDVAIFDYAQLRSPVQVHQLHEAQPETNLVVLTRRPSPAEAQQLLSFGATAIIAKDTDKRDLVTAIHLASRGMHVLPKAGGGLEEKRFGPDLLTPREADVLDLLQKGRSNAEIANELSLGVETVRTHARNIYRKLGVSSRRDLAAAPYLRGR